MTPSLPPSCTEASAPAAAAEAPAPAAAVVATAGAAPAPRLPVRPGNAAPALRISSFVLMAGALLLLMLAGLLPGLLFACLGFLATRWLAELLARVPHRMKPRMAPRLPRWAQVLAAALVVAAPLALLLLGLSQSRSFLSEAPLQYRELLDYVAPTPTSCPATRRATSPPTGVRSAPRCGPGRNCCTCARRATPPGR